MIRCSHHNCGERQCDQPSTVEVIKVDSRGFPIKTERMCEAHAADLVKRMPEWRIGAPVLEQRRSISDEQFKFGREEW